MECINFLRGSFERLGTLLQQAHGKEASKLFPTLEKAQWEEPGMLTIRSFPLKLRAGQALAVRGPQSLAEQLPCAKTTQALQCSSIAQSECLVCYKDPKSDKEIITLTSACWKLIERELIAEPRTVLMFHLLMCCKPLTCCQNLRLPYEIIPAKKFSFYASSCPSAGDRGMM